MKTNRNRKYALRGTAVLLLSVLLISLFALSACGKKSPGIPDETGPASSAGGAGTAKDPTDPTVEERVKAYDFTLTDQYGTEHKLSDYQGQVIFLNFWATWCPPCKQEMPDIEGLYNDHGMNGKDLVILAVAYPDEDGSASAQREMDVEGIKAFLHENNYTFPVLMDTKGQVFNQYQISGLPTTYMIDHQGYFIGYVQGALARELMDRFVNDALNAMGH